MTQAAGAPHSHPGASRAQAQAASRDVDVLVIGAGGGGLVAALRAAEAGASVAIVEKQSGLRGNTWLSSASIPAAGTSLQDEAGIQDDPSIFAEDVRRVSGRTETDHLVEALTRTSRELLEWLKDGLGLDMRLITDYRHVGHSVPRLHSLPSRSGADLVAALERAIGERDIPIAYGNPAAGLLFDAAGRVEGAEIRPQGDEFYRITAGAVVLATNGFGANRALKQRFLPQAAGFDYGGASSSEGEAVLWLEPRGVRLANMQAYQGHAGLSAHGGELVTWTVVEKGGIIVDRGGRRIGNEMVGYSAFADIAARRSGPLHLIFDVRTGEATARGQQSFAAVYHSASTLGAETLDALADRAGIDRGGLAASIAACADFAAGRARDPFGRQAWGERPLAGPVRAIAIKPALFHTQGGVLVDERARVVKTDGTLVDGLYAVGGAAAGISGDNGAKGYVSGNGLLGALGLGFIAGHDAARRVPADVNFEPVR